MKKSEFDLVVKWIKDADRAAPYGVLEWTVSDGLLNEFIELATIGWFESKVDGWHKSVSNVSESLHEYLGMTMEEYKKFIKPKGLI